MSVKTKFSIGDMIVYSTLTGIACEEITSITICSDGVKIYSGDIAGFMWEHEVELATRCGVDFVAHTKIERIKKQATDIKEEYCEDLKDARCDCDFCQQLKKETKKCEEVLRVLMPEPPCNCCHCKG